MGYFLSIYAAAPPTLEDAAREASTAAYLVGWTEAGGIFLAGLILGVVITYVVIKED
jgi:hypothetical protein